MQTKSFPQSLDFTGFLKNVDNVYNYRKSPVLAKKISTVYFSHFPEKTVDIVDN